MPKVAGKKKFLQSTDEFTIARLCGGGLEYVGLRVAPAAIARRRPRRVRARRHVRRPRRCRRRTRHTCWRSSKKAVARPKQRLRTRGRERGTPSIVGVGQATAISSSGLHAATRLLVCTRVPIPLLAR